METSRSGEEGWRGTDGPLHVTRGAMSNSLFRAFIEAGRQAGFTLTVDHNGHKQEGFGPFEQTSWKGRRWAPANAFLRPPLRRSNVSLLRGVGQRGLVHGRRRAGGAT